MKVLRKTTPILAILLILSGVLGSSVWAYWPPCQEVDAWVEGTSPTVTVHYKVKDPTTNSFIEGSSARNDVNQISGLTVKGGMVTWTVTLQNYTRLLCYGVYDPGRGKWQVDQSEVQGFFIDSKAQDGVVACMTVFEVPSDPPGEWFSVEVVTAVYDPGVGTWAKLLMSPGPLNGFYDPVNGYKLVVQEGVVAWLLKVLSPYGSSTYYDYAIYDPNSRNWATENPVDKQGSFTDISIVNATVQAEGLTRGYDAGKSSWYEGPTLPKAAFIAQIPPVEVTAWIGGAPPTMSVHCKAKDPATNHFIERVWSRNDVREISGLTVKDGLATWFANLLDNTHLVCYAAYDPGRKKWQVDQSGVQGFFWDSKAQDGVVACMTVFDTPMPFGNGFVVEVTAAAYDPGVGTWAKLYMSPGPLTGFLSSYKLVVQDGMVAWLLIPPSSSTVYDYALYDPYSRSWATEDPVDKYGTFTDFSIDHATFKAAGLTRGYNSYSHAWYNGPTVLAYIEQPVSGKTPLWVWFTDMSIGGGSITRRWNFGDGSAVVSRSVFHSYRRGGKFTASQILTSLIGSSSSAKSITVQGMLLPHLLLLN
jgi:hypothetical protein